MDIALVTGNDDTGLEGFAAFMTEVDRPLVSALRARDVTVHQPVWTDADVDWSSYDVSLVRTTWDYPDRRDEFLAWADRAGAATTLLNPPDVLRWNSHKSYLLELEDRGAPVVPTAWLGQGDRIDLAELLEARGWSDAVLKPAVGSGGRGMLRVTDDPAELVVGQRHLNDLVEAGDAFVQPFLPSVLARGELSVIVIDGEVSHAVRKVPVAGEYRIHEHRGGRYHVEELTPDVAALATWIVEAAGTPLVAARVDLLEDELGTPQLAELEATEPDLYLYLDGVAHASDRLADALLRRAAPTP